MQQYESVWVLVGYAIIVFYCAQVIEKIRDIKMIAIALAVGAALQGLIGLSQVTGKDFFSFGIGRKMLTAGIDDAAQNTLSYQFMGDNQSSVYMALFNPNYAAVYIINLLPLILMLAITVKKKMVEFYV